MKILKPFTKWWSNTGAESKKKETDPYSKYKPSEDFMERVRRREKQEKERLENWRKELNKQMSTYNGNIGSSKSIWSSTYEPDDITISNNNGPTTLKIDGTIEVQGRNIVRELDEMRDALLLLKRDVDMEAKYPKLKELKDAYEAQLEKYKTFEALK